MGKRIVSTVMLKSGSEMTIIITILDVGDYEGANLAHIVR